MTEETILVDGIPYVRAYPVAPGRCAHCGAGQRGHWTPAAIVAAFHAWNDTHGRGPKESQWAKGTPEHPDFGTVRRVFGSWRKGMAAAGVRPSGGRHMWTAELILERLTDWHFLHGEPPRVNDWRKADGVWPSEATVRKHFGTFNQAVAAAGITPRQKGSRYPVDLPGQRRIPDAFIDAEPVREALHRVDSAELEGVAEAAGVTSDYLYRIKRGRIARVRFSYADRIAVALDRPDLLAA